MKRFSRQLFVGIIATQLWACGGGAPIEVRIDEFAMPFSLDDAVDQAAEQLFASGFLPPGFGRIPEMWPDSLPDIQYSMRFTTPPVPIDLTPDPGSPDAEKYAQINRVSEAIARIEMNRLVLRVEQSNLSIALPEIILQVADDPEANPLDRRAWYSIGRLPSAPPGFVGDLEFEFFPGGESFLYSQFGDEFKECALRAVANISFDTTVNSAMPRGLANLRLIVVATFFVVPEKAVAAAPL